VLFVVKNYFLYNVADKCRLISGVSFWATTNLIIWKLNVICILGFDIFFCFLIRGLLFIRVSSLVLFDWKLCGGFFFFLKWLLDFNQFSVHSVWNFDKLLSLSLFISVLRFFLFYYSKVSMVILWSCWIFGSIRSCLLTNCLHMSLQIINFNINPIKKPRELRNLTL
jgi:hypothetical protein